MKYRKQPVLLDISENKNDLLEEGMASIGLVRQRSLLGFVNIWCSPSRVDFSELSLRQRFGNRTLGSLQFSVAVRFEAISIFSSSSDCSESSLVGKSAVVGITYFPSL